MPTSTDGKALGVALFAAIGSAVVWFAWQVRKGLKKLKGR